MAYGLGAGLRRHVAAADRPRRVGLAPLVPVAALADSRWSHGVPPPAGEPALHRLAARRADDPDRLPSAAHRVRLNRLIALGVGVLPAERVPGAVLPTPERLPADRTRLQRRDHQRVHPDHVARPAASASCWVGDCAETRGRRRTAMIRAPRPRGLQPRPLRHVGPSMWLGSLLAALIGGLCVAPLGVLGGELFPTARRGGIQGLAGRDRV